MVTWLHDWIEHARRRERIFDWAEECPELCIASETHVRVVVERESREPQPVRYREKGDAID